ncbi:arginine biosynthesis argJ [Lentinula lateritia]|nr:arginine biosynthesis argJ [Lentinula lateritia]
MTDAAISPRSLQCALTFAVECNFNSISIDGDIFTNNTILVLANGATAENDGNGQGSLWEVQGNSIDLVKLVVRDGKGTINVTVSYEGSSYIKDPHRVASRISTSVLVKTALYGEDANWGRVLAATGSVSLCSPLNSNMVSVTFVPSDGSRSLPVLFNGEPEKVDGVRANEILSLEDFEIPVDLGGGEAAETAQYWTCDFS